ncbi:MULTISPECIES: hypothetical protein [Acinetobacter]|nr:hypothetical protein [Acinetobacter pittii]MCK0870102.1 hypothetical protein [Acinetobacter pittii]MCK0922247.1 hypothetical protein [Acinetobacter pittii]
MQLKNQQSALQYIHISIPEILLGHIKSKNSWQDYDKEWSYRLDPPHASHPFQRDLYIIKSKNIEHEDIKLLLDNIAIKNNKNSENIEHEDIKLLLDNIAIKNNKNSENIDGAKEIIKKILDLSNNIPIENWLEDTGNRTIIESMIDKNKIKLIDII